LGWDAVVLDELGYLPFSRNGGALLFPLIITPPLAFGEWGQVFYDAKMTGSVAKVLSQFAFLCKINRLLE
jgi:hypothetical protein